MMWLQDLRITVRSLARTPGFALAAITALTLGLGASTAIFSVMDAVLLKPLPYPDAERIVVFLPGPDAAAGRGGPQVPATVFNLLRQQAAGIEHFSGYRFRPGSLTGGATPEPLVVAMVSADFFRLFGGRASHGRTFLAEEDRPGEREVVVLGHDFWRRRFGGDPRVVGTPVSIDGVSRLVVGILEREFDVRVFGLAPDVFLPLRVDPDSTSHAAVLGAAGRLPAATTPAATSASLVTLTAEFRRRFPGVLGPEVAFRAEPLQEVMVRGYRSSLLLVAGAVGLLLLIACANVTNLLAVRGIRRRREMAVRAALGATRAQLLRQLLVECLLLSAAGGLGGLALGLAGARAFLAFSPVHLPRLGDDAAALALDWRVAAFSVLVATGTSFLVGTCPAMRASRASVSETLSASPGPATAGFRRPRQGGGLIAGQIALALVLLACAGLLARTLVALRSVDPGFSPDRILTLQTSLRDQRFGTTASVTNLVRDGVRGLEGLPSVVAAGAATELPLSGTDFRIPFVIVGRPLAGQSHGTPSWRLVSPTWFDALDLPLMRGRPFADGDDADAEGVVIINEALAQRFWSAGDPLGERLVLGQGLGPPFEEPARRIIGIVGDVRDGLGLAQEPRPTVYVALAQLPDELTRLTFRITPLIWMVRTGVEPQVVLGPATQRLQQVAGGLPVSGARTLRATVADSLANADLSLLIALTFAALAVVLAATGVYGLMAYLVQQRVREMGIRLALGADARRVRNLIIGDGMRLAIVGIGIGLAGALGSTRAIESLLFGVTARDPAVLTVAAALLGLVALLAVWLPARQASRVDPVAALRTE